ncbi:MAG: hypothetical protein FWE46_04850 [Coriobacteriia bacterium]|nr:hypothetical protein [Coriobacteriia bacterium]MCL2537478.1 hypothetical protein [Coriobacteriia bacterium]
MKGTNHRQKSYVEVITRTDCEGIVHPLEVIWDDGRHFEISRVLECRQAAALKVGGRGLRYLVDVCGKETYLFFEDPRWFVEEIIYSNAAHTL